ASRWKESSAASASRTRGLWRRSTCRRGSKEPWNRSDLPRSFASSTRGAHRARNYPTLPFSNSPIALISSRVMDTVTLTIDGRQITVAKGKTVLQAAIEDGISVPYYCYHPGIGVDGSCRVCIVRIDKM